MHCIQGMVYLLFTYCKVDHNEVRQSKAYYLLEYIFLNCWDRGRQTASLHLPDSKV